MEESKMASPAGPSFRLDTTRYDFFGFYILPYRVLIGTEQTEVDFETRETSKTIWSLGFGQLELLEVDISFFSSVSNAASI